MATNGEDMVPGLGKKQATVLNNEEGRRTEHKRHLEELGFPKEVDAAFMRYAPVSYDDENPMPSKVVNQAGEDLGLTPKDSLMKQVDIQSIVKEAAQEVFISKEPEPVPTDPDFDPIGWTAFMFETTTRNQAKNTLGKLLPDKIGPKRGKTWGEVKNSPGSKVKFYNPNVRFGGDNRREATYKELMVIPENQRTKQQQRELKNIMDWDYQSEYRTALDMPEYFESIYGEGYIPTYREMKSFLDKHADPVAIGESAKQQEKRGWFNDLGRVAASLLERFERRAFDDTKRPSQEQFNNLLDIQIAESVNTAPEKERGNAFKDLGNIVLDQIDQSIEYATTSLGPKVKEIVDPIFESISNKPELVAPKTGKGPQNVMRDSARAEGTAIAQPRVDTKVEGLKGAAAPKPPTISEKPAKSPEKPIISTERGLQADPGKIGEATNYGRSQEEMDIIARNKANLGSSSAGRLITPDPTRKADGKLYGTVSGTGASDYRIEIKPDADGNVPTEPYTPKDTSADLAATQRRMAEANPDIQPKDSPYLKNMQKQDGFDYGGFAPGTRGLRRTPFSRFAPGSPREEDAPRKEGTPKPTIPKPASLGSGRVLQLPPKLTRPKDRYDDKKQQDLQTSPEPPNLKVKSMQKYQAWLQKAEDEGAMAKVQLDRVSDLADMMHDVLDENDELPGWIQNKISDSLHNLEASFTHLAYDAKQDLELAKSKEAFQDFLAKAPQSGGTLLKNELYLQKAVPVLAPLLGLLGRVLGVGAAKKLISGGAKKTLKNADVAKKAGLLGTLKGGLKWFGIAAVGDEILEQAGLVDDPGYIDVGKYYNKVQEMASANPDAGNMMADSGNTINQEVINWATNTKDSIRDGLDTAQQKIFDNAYNNPAQALPKAAADIKAMTDVPKDITPTVHQAPPEFKPAGYVEPIYDTSPEAEARVRSGGSESIIGANVNGQKYRFKAPIKNMGGVNQALHRATPDSSL